MDSTRLTTGTTRPAAVDADTLRRAARFVIDTEAAAVAAMAQRIDEHFVAACTLLLECGGRVVVAGMGKSGHVGRKMAATLASLGTPAFFVHPAEASHGDLGMITEQDVVIAISNSGETAELTTILPVVRRIGAQLIAMTGNAESFLATQADVHLDVSVDQEACPLGLAPTASTTATLAMGDALAVALLEARGFGVDDFALSHPGGSLGRRLLLTAADLMQAEERLPAVAPGTPLSQVLVVMTRARLGIAVIADADRQVQGVFTEGDLLRCLERRDDVHTALIDDVMTRECTTVAPGLLAAEAARIMQEKRINAVPVTDAQGRLIGVFNMQDLLAARVL